MKYAKDSIERFGDDSLSEILSFLPNEDKQKFFNVSPQWSRCMYNMAHFVTIEYPHAPLFDIKPDDDMNVLVNRHKHIKYFESRRAFKLDIYTSPHCLSYIADYVRNAPSVQELKIRMWNSEMPDEYILEVIEIISRLKHLKRIHLNFNFKFKNHSAYQVFTKHFSSILGEISIEGESDFCYNIHYITGLKSFNNLKVLTLTNSTHKKKWLEGVADATPQLSKLYLVRTYHKNFANISINYVLKLWGDLSYVLMTDQEITPRHDLSIFKILFRSIAKQEILSHDVNPTQFWAHEVVYSKAYKSLFLARHDNNKGRLPQNIEHLIFVDHWNRRHSQPVSEQISNILKRNKGLRSLRINSKLIDACRSRFLSKAINNPNINYLLGDLSCDYYFEYNNFKTNLEL